MPPTATPPGLGSRGRLRRPLRLELVAAGLALAAATALVAFPNPPREAEATARAAGTDPVLADLASHDALSLAEASGPFVVGLTVLPPRPGPVELRVHVVGVDAGEGLTNAVVHLSGPGADGEGALAVALKPCGAGCFRGRTRVERAGTWSFAFSASSTRGPVEARFETPLPAPDGTSALDEAMAALERLRSKAMNEEIRGTPAGPVTIVRYRFSAPDAFEFDDDESHNDDDHPSAVSHIYSSAGHRPAHHHRPPEVTPADHRVSTKLRPTHLQTRAPLGRAPGGPGPGPDLPGGVARLGHLQQRNNQLVVGGR